MALKFGQAIRDGDVGGVKHFVDQKGAAEALKGRYLYEVCKILTCLIPLLVLGMEFTQPKLILKSGCHISIALKVKFSFEIMVQRLVVYKSERCLPPAMESVTIQVIHQWPIP